MNTKSGYAKIETNGGRSTRDSFLAHAVDPILSDDALALLLLFTDQIGCL